MANTYRKNDPISTKKAELALKEILRGFFFRHEFARRSRDKNRKKFIEAASEDLLAKFSFPPGRGRRFIAADSSECLPLELIKQCRDEDKKSASLRVALRDFLTKYRILPVGRMEESFFPKYIIDSGGKNLDLYRIYISLFNFEYFAIAKLGFRAPVIFPVLIIGRLKTRDGLFRIHNMIDPEKHQSLILIDQNVPEETVRAYTEIDRLRERVTRNPKETLNPVRKYNRHTWKQYKWYLKAYDLSLNNKGDKKGLTNKYEKLVKDSAPVKVRKNPDGKTNAGQRNHALRQKYYYWLKVAQKLCRGQHYMQII